VATAQHPRHVLVRQALHDQRQHLALARRELGKALLGIAIGLALLARAHMLAHGSLQGLDEQFVVHRLFQNSAAPALKARRHMSTVPWPVSRTMG
jgi:hypothetical protein